MLAPVALLGVLLLAVVQINLYFSINPTLGDLLGTTVAGIPTLESKYTRAADAASASAVTPDEVPGHLAADKAVAGQWRPPADLPAHGLLRQAAVPGTVSGFVARNAYIYLPPAYLVPGHPPLPVLVLFPGQPGAPSDWLTGGQLASTLDSYAAAHSGLAPVTVVVDPLGSQDANTLCMDSTIARADTYLSVDVPQWISTTLDVQPGADRWAVGGFSFGATCALQLAARHPDVFPNVIAFAAEREPALAKDRSKTIQEAFGGNAEAFDSRTPLVILASTRFVHSSAYFSVGADDTAFVADMSELSAAARGAGFRVETSTVPGIGHSWAVPVRKMDEALGFLAPRAGADAMTATSTRREGRKGFLSAGMAKRPFRAASRRYSGTPAGWHGAPPSPCWCWCCCGAWQRQPAASLPAPIWASWTRSADGWTTWSRAAGGPFSAHCSSAPTPGPISSQPC